MKTKILLSAVLVLGVMLAACAPKAAAATRKAIVATAIPPAAKATTIPTRSAKTSPTTIPNTAPTKQAASKNATPLPALINDILVDDQSVQSGSVLVGLVDSIKPGWVAIFTDKNGEPGDILGYTAVPAGTSEDLKVNIDAKKATDKMIAMLLVDSGTIGTFEYPGADEPVRNANINTNVMASFNRLNSSSQ